MRSHSNPRVGCLSRRLLGPLVGAFLVTVLSGGVLAGCAGRAATVARPHTPLDVPDELDDATFARVERAYRRLSPDDPQRGEVRERLVRHLLTEAERAHVAEEYEAAVEKLAKIASFYRPEELASGLIKEMLPLAE